MKAVLLDDEQYVLDNLVFLLKQFDNVEILLATTEWKEAMQMLLSQEVDVVFADIEMPGMTGLELGEWISVKAPTVKLVFLTAHTQYALEAFQVRAVDYILKPVTVKKLSETMNRLSKYGLAFKAEPEKKALFRIVGNKNNQFILISPDEGLYIEVIQREIRLVTRKQTYTLNHNMNYWEENLKSYNWFRCHKSFLVNLNQVESVYPMFNSVYQLKLKGHDAEIPVSRTYLKDFKQKLGF